MDDRSYMLALDIGTTAIKVIAFESDSMAMLGSVTAPMNKDVIDDTVEQDPVMLIKESVRLLQEIVAEHQLDPRYCVGLGITNQRETTILWDAKTGEPVYPAIVWEDKRTQAWCDAQSQELHDLVEEKAGLSLLPYFSASKIVWMLDHVQGLRDRVQRGEVLFGTVDTWILWNISKEQTHATDWTNASRTLLFDAHERAWSTELCEAFDIPMFILPRVQKSASAFGNLRADILGIEVPILAVCGDQQSSLFAAEQYCGEEIGCTKMTFGTGFFLMQMIGEGVSVEKPFYPSLCLTPDAQDLRWALEYKIEGIGAQVQSRLHDTRELDRYLDRLTDDVARIVERLPHQPEEIVIDGGVTQNQHLRGFLQEKIPGSHIIQLSTYNGTALGVALLVKTICDQFFEKDRVSAERV